MEVERVSELRSERALTSRQEQILRIAYERGYFDAPKGINLRSLSKLLNISPPTLSELLKRGQKKILREHFRGRASASLKRGAAGLGRGRAREGASRAGGARRRGR